MKADCAGSQIQDFMTASAEIWGCAPSEIQRQSPWSGP